MRLTTTILFILFTTIAIGQSYSGPESVEFDYTNRRWLIGNTTSHQILSRDSLGNLSVLVNNTASGPYGIEIVGDTLFCCSGASIKGYLLSNGSSVYSVATGGSFLNGLTHDDQGNLIATDFSAKKIFKINIASQLVTTIATAMTSTPNGIIFDAANNRCVFVNWGSNAPIKAIDLSTNTITTLLSTTLSSCDGITRDGAGRYYITNWGLQTVLRYDSSFAAPPSTVATALSNPADIFYNVVDDTLGIPNAGNNTVRFVGFASTVGIETLEPNSTMLAFPNPAKIGQPVKCSFANNRSSFIELTDQTGKIIKTFSSDLELSTDQLKAGYYFLRMEDQIIRLLIQ